MPEYCYTAPTCTCVDITECEEYNATVTYGKLCVYIGHVLYCPLMLRATGLSLLVFMCAGLQTTVTHQLHSVVLATVCMETALTTLVHVLRMQLVSTVKLCQVCA